MNILFEIVRVHAFIGRNELGNPAPFMEFCGRWIPSIDVLNLADEEVAAAHVGDEEVFSRTAIAAAMHGHDGVQRAVRIEILE